MAGEQRSKIIAFKAKEPCYISIKRSLDNSVKYFMMKSLIALLLMIFVQIRVLANDLTIECDGDGNLTNIFSSTNPAICLEEAESLKGIQKITDKLQETTKSLSLKSRYKGLNSIKNSDQYDLAAIDEIIRVALEADVDPIATLAILILENPPLLKKDSPLPSDSSEAQIDELLKYENLYGAIPVDNIAALDVLNCKIEKPTWADLKSFDQTKVAKLENSAKKILSWRRKFFELLNAPQIVSYLVLSEQMRLSEMTKNESKKSELSQKLKAISSETKVKEFLDIQTLSQKEENDQYEIISSMQLTLEDQALINCVMNTGDDCRGIVKSQKNVPHFNLSAESPANKELMICSSSAISAGGNIAFQVSSSGPGRCCTSVSAPSEMNINRVNQLLKVRLGLEYIKKNVQSLSGKGKDVTLALQRFNGMGCFGCSEAKEILGDSCMGLIDMSNRPVYGAKAADLMINMLLNNPKILSIIEKHRKLQKTKIKNLLCLSFGGGRHHIDDQKYHNLLKEFLLKGHSGNYTLAFKTANGKFELRRPLTQVEKDFYTNIETRRARICEKYFK